MRRFSVREITLAAVIAAVYVALTFALPFPPYMGVQFRVAERRRDKGKKYRLCQAGSPGEPVPHHSQCQKNICRRTGSEETKSPHEEAEGDPKPEIP